MMNIEIGKTALVTADQWFYAPDGKTYNAVFGKVHAVRSSLDLIGVEQSGKYANWFLEIGNMTIAGCQIKYAVRCDEINSGEIEEYKVLDHGDVKIYKRPSNIYRCPNE